MNPVRRLFTDLVEKRLWPIALALLVTAVAIPVLIGGGGSAGVPDPVAPPEPVAASATPAVQLVGPPAVRSRKGAIIDPFRRSKATKAAAEPSTQQASGTPASSAAAPVVASGGSSDAKSHAAKPAPSKPAPSKRKALAAIDPAVALAARSSYQTVVRLARPTGVGERALARLAVLGNAANPALQYIGVSSSASRAIFVLGPNATADGDPAACVVADPCRAIALRQGDKLGIDVVGEGSVVRHYELEVTRVRPLRMPSAKRARAWRKRVDAAGPAVLKLLAHDATTAAVLERLKYAPSTGTVSLLSAP